MGMTSGQGTSLQIGIESTWGTAVTPTVAINYTSEGFKFTVDRAEEETLVSGATSREMDIMKKSVDFDFSLLAKPENIGELLSLALGAETSPVAVTGATGAYKHTFTPMKPSSTASLPKFTAVVNRHVATKKYTGCKIDTMKISCAAGDYMKIDFSGKGKDEVSGTSASGLSISALKAFRFAGGTVSFDGTAYGNVTDITFDYSNALDDGEQTTGSGYYGTESEPQKRSIGVSMTAFYDSTSETIHENKYKTETKAAVVLKFESPSMAVGTTPYSIEISMPLVVITECSPNVSGTDKIKLTIAGTATESASADAVSIILVDKKSTKYIA